jgi:hypothetical protein
VRTYQGHVHNLTLLYVEVVHIISHWIQFSSLTSSSPLFYFPMTMFSSPLPLISSPVPPPHPDPDCPPGLLLRVGKGFFQRGVCACAFTSDAVYVSAAGCDDKHTIGTVLHQCRCLCLSICCVSVSLEAFRSMKLFPTLSCAALCCAALCFAALLYSM